MIFSKKINEILVGANPKNSGIDEGMTPEDYQHKSLLLLAYIALKLESIEEFTCNIIEHENNKE